jgi:acyl carrier protein
MTKNVHEIVLRILEDQLGVDESEVTADATLDRDLSADTLDAIEIVMSLEEKFGIEIPDEDFKERGIERFTVAELEDYIWERIKS